MKGLYEDRDAATAAAEKIRAFAQAQRLMILSCLLQGERNVGEIAEITGIGQPALSQQLGELRRAELVQTRKEAKQVWYMLASESVALCMRNIEAMFAGIGSAQPVVTQSARDAPPVTAGVASFAQIIGR
ncbi:ArsR family transcriptional regulator [Sphingobium herbicidovorans NBRC 16415]|uniref:ArsR family transcriptional regulator n=1 Tax=Sphingobium herbicidovorans (strain ATCC 700291 / DSM 11019 / CCUG 56400 / KCTC 2939 / LMG 18315 / NBRC 16415 / MH) TaxID=1219045 RepID=A0A086P6F8_SPHHM|nr:metalloregulator ArsR/SmtB family transcription factor [Sphingobium herbicidovorans]KFG88976.1 ArsR family transcriptional regulator [Sphingobium herbicidovorans NBRC 16415]